MQCSISKQFLDHFNNSLTKLLEFQTQNVISLIIQTSNHVEEMVKKLYLDITTCTKALDKVLTDNDWGIEGSHCIFEATSLLLQQF